jgi:hypothetical protein
MVMNMDKGSAPKIFKGNVDDSLDLECVWYCGSCCGCGLKKVVL